MFRRLRGVRRPIPLDENEIGRAKRQNTKAATDYKQASRSYLRFVNVNWNLFRSYRYLPSDSP